MTKSIEFSEYFTYLLCNDTDSSAANSFKEWDSLRRDSILEP